MLEEPPRVNCFFLKEAHDYPLSVGLVDGTHLPSWRVYLLLIDLTLYLDFSLFVSLCVVDLSTRHPTEAICDVYLCRITVHPELGGSSFRRLSTLIMEHNCCKQRW